FAAESDCVLFRIMTLVPYENFLLQAEDGIRARNVTGVQTCALPISYDDSHKSLYDRYILFECSQSGVLSVSLFLLAPVGATCNMLIDLFLIPHKVRLS